MSLTVLESPMPVGVPDPQTAELRGGSGDSAARLGSRPSNIKLVFGDGSDPKSRAQRRWRRARWTVFVFACLAIVVGALAVTRPSTTGTPFAPDSVAPQGARAVAQVLNRQGVTIHYVRSVAAAVAAAGENSTLVVAPTWLLDSEDMALLAAVPANLVLLAPMPELVSLVSDARVGVWIIASDATVLEPQCSAPAAVTAGAILSSANLTVPGGEEPGLAACYPVMSGTRQLFSFVQLAHQNRTVSIIADAEIITNATIAIEGHAALALSALGENPDLVWLVVAPNAATAAAQPSLIGLLPPWAIPVALTVGLTVLVLTIVQGRRLGPLVSEDLPVVVSATETTRGLGRLYRNGRARGHAAAALRAENAARIAKRIGLPPTTTPEALVAAISRATGKPQSDIAALFYGPSPQSDNELVAQTKALDEIEKEVNI